MTASRDGTPAPGSAAIAGGVSGTDRITHHGTARAASLSRTVSATSCATVELDDRASAGNVTRPRYDTRVRQPGPMAGSNAIALDGSAYAAAVSTHRVDITNGVTYGVGVWFRASATVLLLRRQALSSVLGASATPVTRGPNGPPRPRPARPRTANGGTGPVPPRPGPRSRGMVAWTTWSLVRTSSSRRCSVLPRSG